MSEKRDSILSDDVADVKWSAFADQGHNEWETKGLPCDERSWRHGWRSAGWHLDDLIKKGDLIRKDELVAWLDAEIALAEENVEIANANASMGAFKGKVVMDTMLATYKAVKAHIKG